METSLVSRISSVFMHSYGREIALYIRGLSGHQGFKWRLFEFSITVGVSLRPLHGENQECFFSLLLAKHINHLWSWGGLSSCFPFQTTVCDSSDTDFPPYNYLTSRTFFTNLRPHWKIRPLDSFSNFVDSIVSQDI